MERLPREHCTIGHAPLLCVEFPDARSGGFHKESGIPRFCGPCMQSMTLSLHSVSLNTGRLFVCLVIAEKTALLETARYSTVLAPTLHEPVNSHSGKRRIFFF
ncbi:hypothetical protein TcCL_NonESM02419 [Trypanosoma cruzi]|nr:hypothetical protein TcCL_NonESM02419 [Trypanosoma cruzi]